MGFMRTAKVDVLSTDAERAYSEGRSVFVARLMSPVSAPSVSGSLGDVANMIEAVEANGWRLDSWSESVLSKMTGDRPAFTAVFRRVADR